MKLLLRMLSGQLCFDKDYLSVHDNLAFRIIQTAAAVNFLEVDSNRMSPKPEGAATEETGS